MHLRSKLHNVGDRTFTNKAKPTHCFGEYESMRFAILAQASIWMKHAWHVYDCVRIFLRASDTPMGWACDIWIEGFLKMGIPKTIWISKLVLKWSNFGWFGVPPCVYCHIQPNETIWPLQRSELSKWTLQIISSAKREGWKHATREGSLTGHRSCWWRVAWHLCQRERKYQSLVPMLLHPASCCCLFYPFLDFLESDPISSI